MRSLLPCDRGDHYAERVIRDVKNLSAKAFLKGDEFIFFYTLQAIYPIRTVYAATGPVVNVEGVSHYVVNAPGLTLCSSLSVKGVIR